MLAHRNTSTIPVFRLSSEEPLREQPEASLMCVLHCEQAGLGRNLFAITKMMGGLGIKASLLNQ